MITNRMIVNALGKFMACITWLSVVVPFMMKTTIAVWSAAHPECPHSGDLPSIVACAGFGIMIPTMITVAMSTGILYMLLRAVDLFCDIGAMKVVRDKMVNEERAQRRFAEDVREALQSRPDYRTLITLLARASSERLGDGEDVVELKAMLLSRATAVKEQERRRLVTELKSEIEDAWPEIDEQFTLHEQVAEVLDDVERQRREA